MKITEYIRHSSVGVKLIVLLILILCGVFVIAIPMLFVQGEYALLTGMYLQNIGMFILPAWFAAMLFWGNAGRGLRLNKAPRLIDLLCIVILYFVATPMFNRLVEWNESINLPEAFASIEAWMRQQEEAAAAGIAAQVVLPVGACVLFAAAVLLLGRRALWVSAFPAGDSSAFRRSPPPKAFITVMPTPSRWQVSYSSCRWGSMFTRGSS